jgi:nucleolar protein 56
VAERERADDQQLIHAIRAYDDCQRTTNELTERVAEWAGSHDAEAEVSTEYVHELAEGTGQSPVEDRLIGLAERVAGLEEERESLRSFVERTAPEVAPNLSALAGPELAARLIAIAGGLESLAKKPAGTVQVLGAEDALFAHLGGNAPSPKHGVIFTHPAVRQASPDNRGSAARALAGKLTIAARVDHYSGDLRPELQADLDDRIERIHARDDE